MTLRLGIIGSGLSGLVLGRKLSPFMDVTILDKSRGMGGRLATRRRDSFHFDHGAPYFEVQSDAFLSFCNPFVQSGVLTTWNARWVTIQATADTVDKQSLDMPPVFIGTPTMTAFPKAIAQGLSVHLNQPIESVERREGLWYFQTRDNTTWGPFDWIVSTAPPAQSEALLPPFLSFHASLGGLSLDPSYTAMLGFDLPCVTDFDAARVLGSPISFIGVNSAKPGRPNWHSLCLHSTAQWAVDNVGQNPDSLLSGLVSEASRLVNHDLRMSAHAQLHRWGYAQMPATSQQGAFSWFDSDHNAAFCGDSCSTGGVEGAFQSASDCAQQLREILL